MILKNRARVFALVAGLLATSAAGLKAELKAGRNAELNAAGAGRSTGSRTVGSEAPRQGGGAPPVCDPAFAALFTPLHPVLGRYEVCTDPLPLADIAPADWTIEALEPGEAFGGAGSYDRAALAKLYSGRRPRVARGWTETADRFEAMTLISPYPNATVTTLEPGTLIIRWICDHGGAECKMLNAGR
jgi:hypothetical protein